MKKFLVVLLACVMIFGFATTALAADTQIKEFSDIADQSQAAKNAIMKLAVLGVIEGNEGIGGAFRPADNLTRAEFAKIVCYLTDNGRVAESLASVGSKFSDVSTGNWYTGWVNAAAQSGYFMGDPGGTFRPNANITMQEVVTVALRAAGYNEKLGSATGNTTWPGNYITKAMSIGVLDDVTFVGSAAATRADMAIICNEVLGINMVVHINNDIAYALALSDGTVDPDGFSEIYYISNETKRGKVEETILHKAFKGQYYYMQVAPADVSSRERTNNLTEPKAEFFDESKGWSYEDYDSNEIYLALYNQKCYEDEDFDAYVYQKDSNGNVKTDKYEYGVTESLASTYYITGDNSLSDLSGMQVQITVIDDKEIAFVDVYSSYVLAQSVYKNSSSNIVADGKTYRASNTMEVGSKVNSSASNDPDKLSGVVDLSEGATFGADSDGNPNKIQNLYDSSSDDDFPGKVYLDKDGRVYATKNYNAYNDVPFGIVDEVDSNEVVLKAQANEWKTSGTKGSATNYTLDTGKEFVLLKDGEIIKADELDENDVITYLGDNGAHFYYVTSPTEGELTQQTSSKMTVAGFGYRQVTGFNISDDGGQDFIEYKGFSKEPIDTASFGEVEIALAYNFSRIDYIALNTTANKVIGVVTDADPDSSYVSGTTNFDPQFKSLTIYNSEGKEVKYTFTTNFRNAYNYKLAHDLNVPNAVYSSSSSANGKFDTEYFSTDKSLEKLARAIEEGDIVQLTLDKNDNIKKITNYVAFDATDDKKVEATVKSSNNRITINGNSVSKENGTYTLPSDAIVFNVSADGTKYDDVALKTVASTLSGDFKAAKIVAFDTKSNGNINYMYIVEGVSAYKFGIISGQGRDATDDYFTMNGKRLYSDGTRAKAPSLVAYQISGGDAKVAGKYVDGTFDGYLAWGTGKNVQYLNNMHDLVKLMDPDYGAAVGIVDSYSSGTNALNVAGKLLYVTSDTFMYDFVLDDDISSASSLRNKFVAAIYDKDFDVIAVALLGEKSFDGQNVTGSGTVVEPATNVEKVEADVKLVEAGTYAIPFANQTTDAAKTAWVKAEIEKLFKYASTVTVMPDVSIAGSYTVTLSNATVDGEEAAPKTATINVTLVQGGNAATLTNTVFGQTVTWTLNANGYYVVTDPAFAAFLVDAGTYTWDKIVTATDPNATINITTVSYGGTAIAKSYVVAVPSTPTLYVTVTSQDGLVVNYYQFQFTAALPSVTSVTVTANATGLIPTGTLTAVVKDAANNTVTGAANVGYQWQRSANGILWDDINLATNATYTIAGGDVGQYLRVVATATAVTSTHRGTVTSDPVQVETDTDAVAVANEEAAKVGTVIGAVSPSAGDMRVVLTGGEAGGTAPDIESVTIGGTTVATGGFVLNYNGVTIPTSELVEAATVGNVVVKFTVTENGTKSDEYTITIPQATVFNANVIALRNDAIAIDNAFLAMTLSANAGGSIAAADIFGTPTLDAATSISGAGLVQATTAAPDLDTTGKISQVVLSINSSTHMLQMAATASAATAADGPEDVDFAGILINGGYRYNVTITVEVDVI